MLLPGLGVLLAGLLFISVGMVIPTETGAFFDTDRSRTAGCAVSAAAVVVVGVMGLLFGLGLTTFEMTGP